MDFIVRQVLAGISTAKFVEVMAVTSTGDIAAPGTVDVRPVVSQVDGNGQPTPHATIYGIPFLRQQAGPCAIIMDPRVGDFGLMVVCDRDGSVFRNTGAAPVAPGSWRQFDMADGVFLPYVGRSVPTSAIQFDADNNIRIVTDQDVSVQADNVTVTADTKVTVTAPEVDVISDNVNLGGTGGARVALVGDAVAGGVITGPGTTKVKAV